MTMSATTLKNELVNMGLFTDEPSAIAGWAAAFRKYFEDAVAGAVPVTKPALATPEAAMVGAMAGLSTAGAAAITAGITAFWTSLAASPAAYFTGATVITPPPGLAGLTALLTATFATNTSTSASASAAYTAIAANIHTSNAGGSATLPGPVVTPIT